MTEVDYQDVLAEIRFLLEIKFKIGSKFIESNPLEGDMLQHLEMIIDDRIIDEVVNALNSNKKKK